MTTLYVAGPMTGLPDCNYRAFHDAAAQLRVLGFDVENPAENHPEGEQTWLNFMRMSLVQISKADGIATLPGWSSSKGASLEVHIAERLGLPVRPVGDWIFEADMENRSLTVEPVPGFPGTETDPGDDNYEGDSAPSGLAHTCSCARLPYAHLSSTASGCPR